MFIEPYFRSKRSAERFAFSRETALTIPDGFDPDRASYLRDAISDTLIPQDCSPIRTVTVRIGKPTPALVGKDDPVIGTMPEEYCILIGRSCELIAPNEESVILGLSALRQAIEAGESWAGVLYSYPPIRYRGYRVFLPGSACEDSFRDTVDMLAYYQYNTITLEVGGAMEYKRHPEINEAWKKASNRFLRESGLAKKVVRQYAWAKNAIHCDNGNGEILTQEKVRELIAYCHSRGLEVIPEAPTLSHCDYLLLPHPEFAERPYDEYPDTYCPLHPDVYKYVFDVLDEILDVFRPKIVNIGHDECYSIATDRCPRCAGRVASDLYTQDIVKFYFYLKAKGIETMMWGEKLLAAHNGDDPIGGSERWWVDEDGNPVRRSPYLADCAYKIPREVIMLNWYAHYDKAYDLVYHNNGYRMIFGNCNVAAMEDWSSRKKRCIGAIASNWGSFLPEYMQRNQQYFTLIFNARAIAGHDYDGAEETRPADTDRCMEECYRFFHRHCSGNLIEAVHTTACSMNYEFYYDGNFIDSAKYLLGEYVLTYDDGYTASLPVIYGQNISCGDTADGAQLIIGDTTTAKAAAYRLSSSYRAVSCSTLPFEENGTVYYRTVYENPHPGHRISGWRYRAIKTETVETLALAEKA